MPSEWTSQLLHTFTSQQGLLRLTWAHILIYDLSFGTLADYANLNRGTADSSSTHYLRVREIMKTFLSVTCLLLAFFTIAVTQVRVLSGVSCLMCMLLLILHVAAENARSPTTFFGRWLLITTTANVSAYNWLARSGYLEQVQTSVFTLLIVLTFVFPFYMQLSGIPSKYRCLWFHVVGLGFIFSPGISVAGTITEDRIFFSCFFVALTWDRCGGAFLAFMSDARSEPSRPSDGTAEEENGIPEVDFFKTSTSFGFFNHSFDGRLMEEQYSTKLFDASYKMFCYAMEAILLGAAYYAYLDTGLRSICLLGLALLASLLVARSKLEQMADRQQARKLYSQAVACEGILSSIIILILAHNGFITHLISGQHLIAGTFLLGLCPIFFWVSAVKDWYRSMWSAAMACLSIFAPPFSTLGQPSENVMVLGGLALGELVGYTIVQLHRNSFVHSKESRRSAQAEKRALRAERTTARLEVERNADSRLNHLIKSKCGASLQLTWMLRKQMHQAGLHRDARDGHSDSALTGEQSTDLSASQFAHLMKSHDKNLELIATQLESVMDWVHRRQVFVQLESHTYSSSCISCDLRHEISKILLAVVDNRSAKVDIQCDEVILVDKNVLNIAIEEGVSNAEKYRRPGTPVEVIVHMEDNPECPRDENCEHVLVLEIRNQNPSGVPRLTAEECQRVFKAGYKAHTVSALSGESIASDQHTTAMTGLAALHRYSSPHPAMLTIAISSPSPGLTLMQTASGSTPWLGRVRSPEVERICPRLRMKTANALTPR